MSQHRLAALAAASVLLAACGGGEGDEGGPTMRPGSDCLSCHTGGEPGRFTAAGTVYGRGDAASGAGLAGVTVVLVGSGAGETPAPLVTNGAGNFYTSAKLTPPISITVTGNGGSVSRPSHHAGSCGGCHQPGSGSGAPDRVHVGVQTSACAPCHT